MGVKVAGMEEETGEKKVDAIGACLQDLDEKISMVVGSIEKLEREHGSVEALEKSYA